MKHSPLALLHRCLIIVLATLYHNTFAQEQPSRLEVAALGGLTFATLTDHKSPHNEFDYHAGSIQNFSYGIQLKYRIVKSIWITSGLGWNTLGSNIDYEKVETNFISLSQNRVDDNRWKRRIENQYLNVPLTLEYHSRGKLSWLVKAGGYLGFLKKSNVEGSSISIQIVDGQMTGASYEEFSTRSTEHTNSTDYGITFGSGVTYPIGKKLKIQFEVITLVGLNELDAVFNNDVFVGTSSYVVMDYFGLNSHCRNMAAGLNAGLSYSLK